jgi:hypothetical protein
MWKPWDILYSNYLGQTMKVKACKKKHEPVKISGSWCLKLKATTKIDVEHLSFLDNFLWKTMALWISIAIVVFWRVLKQPSG